VVSILEWSRTVTKQRENIMNIVKPVEPIFSEKPFEILILNRHEVVYGLMNSYRLMKQTPEFDVHQCDATGQLIMFFYAYGAGPVRMTKDHRDVLYHLYKVKMAEFEVNLKSKVVDEPFYAFDAKKEIHISVTDNDVVFHHTELDCLVFDIVNGI
jgi:hypothetical protein